MVNSIKSSVSAKGIQPELVLGISIVISCFNDMGYNCVITSLLDSVHGAKSLHSSGFASDFRIKHISKAEDVYLLVKNCRQCLGSDFDVVLESDHIHVEFDPKK